MTDLDPRRELALLLLLTAVMFITIVDFMVLMPLSPYLMTQFHVTPARFGLLVSAYSLAAGAASLLAASIADRYDRRHALLATFAGLTIATAGCALAVDFYTLLAARTVAGVFGGVIGSIVLSIVGDVVPPARRGRAMGWVMLGFSLAAVAGVPLGLFLAEHQGWRAPFAALAVLSALVWLAVWREVPPVREHLAQAPTGLWQGYRELLVVPNHWWACGVTALTMLSGFSVIPYIAPTQVANVGLDPHYLMWIYLAGGGATLFTRPLIGRLTDRYRQAHVYTALVLLSFIPIVLVTQTLPLSFVWQLGFTTLFFIFVSGRFIPASALVTGATESRLRGRLMAFNSAVQNFASGVAAFVAGLMMSQGPGGEMLGFGWVGLMSCVFGLIGIAAAYRVKAVG